MVAAPQETKTAPSPKELAQRGVDGIIGRIVKKDMDEHPKVFLDDVRQFVKHKKSLDKDIRLAGEDVLNDLALKDKQIVVDHLKSPLIQQIREHRFPAEGDIDPKLVKEDKEIAKMLGLLNDRQVCGALGLVSHRRRNLLAGTAATLALGGVPAGLFQLGRVWGKEDKPQLDNKPPDKLPHQEMADPRIPPNPTASPSPQASPAASPSPEPSPIPRGPLQPIEAKPAGSPSPKPEVKPPSPETKPKAQPTPEQPKPPEKKRELFEEFIIPKLYEIALQRRKDRRILNPESIAGVNPELNEKRISFLFVGIGKEGMLADSIMVGSYDMQSKIASQISFPRDLQSPENLQATGDPGHSRINQMFSIKAGSPDHARKIIANATGLEVDFIVINGFDSIVEVIDGMGGIKVNLEKPIHDPSYPAREGFGFDPFFIEAGEHMVDGETALKIARSRLGGRSDYDRAGEQQNVAQAIGEKAWEKIRDTGNVKASLDEANKIFDLIEEQVKKGNLQLDFDINQFRPTLTNLVKNTPWLSVPGIIKEELVGKGWKIGSKPETRQFVIRPSSDPNENLVADAGVPKASITKIPGGNPYDRNPVTGYWQKLRTQIETFLKAQK